MTTTKLPPLEKPKRDFIKRPNNWLDASLVLLGHGGNSAAGIKIITLMLSHSWVAPDGQHHCRQFGVAELRRGFRRHHQSGTGLTDKTIRSTLRWLIDMGYVTASPSDSGTKYRLVFDDGDGIGMPYPSNDYYMLPKQWTDTCCHIKSPVVIRLIEYLMMHTWRHAHPLGLWLTAKEIMHGRRNLKTGVRYDHGISCADSSGYAAINEAIQLGLLIWTDRNPDGSDTRLYCLAQSDYPYDNESGEYTGRLPWEWDIQDADDADDEYAEPMPDLLVGSRLYK